MDASVLFLEVAPSPHFQLEKKYFPVLSEELNPVNTQTEVIVFLASSFFQAEKQIFFRKLQSELPHVRWIALAENQLPATQFLELQNFGIHRVLGMDHLENLERGCLLEMEHERNRKQQAQLHQLFEEQHAQWQTARAELERRISVRKNELEEHIRKAEQATFKWKLMNEMVMRIFQANSLHELETFLFLALKEDLEIDSCRLRFPLAHGTTAVGKEKDATTVNIPLSGPTSPQGILSFHRFHKKFSKEEQEFLKKIAEPVLLAVDRILQNQMVEEILNQWQLTFDAITDPVLLINDQFEIIQSNAAFKKRSNFQNQAAVSGPTLCYQALFQRTSPCEGCKKGHFFPMTQNQQGQMSMWEVHGHSVPAWGKETALSFHLYREVTHQKHIQRKILESTKLTELGTIGSSIAHELNNPLGGMLSFVQLIKMDLPKNDPSTSDYDEIEIGIRRCKDIVQNLLGFTRQSQLDQPEKFPLSKVLDQVRQILLLQTKTSNIDLEIKMPSTEIQILGFSNMFAQALKNIFQNSVEAIHELQKVSPQHKGKIEVNVLIQEEELLLQIIDNGIGMSPESLDRCTEALYSTKDPHFHPGLGLTVAQQIFVEHQTQLKIRSTPRRLTIVEILVPRPVFT